MRLVSDDTFSSGNRGVGYQIGKATQKNDLVKPGDLVASFTGVNAVLRSIDEQFPYGQGNEDSIRRGGDGFRHFATFDEAMDVFLNEPWRVRNFKAADVSFNDPDSAGTGVRFDVVGSVLDVGRYLEGDPEPFMEMTDGNPVGKAVTLLLNIGALARVDISWIELRSQRIQRLVDLLESQQVRVHIEAVRANGISLTEIAIKEYDEPLSLNDLAICTHPDFLRRVLFRVDEWSDNWTSGHGSSEHLDKWLFDHPILPESSSELSIVISSRIGSLAQVDEEFDAAEKWLVDTLAENYLSPQERCLHMFRSMSAYV